MPYLGLIVLVVLIVAIVDIVGAEEHQIRGLPRFAWLLLVLILPLAGSIAWFIAGRPTAGARPPRRLGGTASFPEYDKPNRYIPEDVEADEEFLRRCRERAEQQRREAKRLRDENPPD